jgi:hypothetical protein
MTRSKRFIAAMAMAVLGTSAVTISASADETLRYDWRLRGALSWIARVKFPTSGTGVLQTSPGGGGIASQLHVSGGGRDYIEYQSLMDPTASRTLTSANGYSFGAKSERKETVYDYASNLVRLNEREQGTVASKTRPLPVENARDVLTTIAYLRTHAAAINAPLMTDVFAEGKAYRVTIKPEGLKTADWQGRQVPARVFQVVAAPGAPKKFPGLTVWLSEDAQRLPLRIVIDQQYASLDLRLRAV